MAESLNKKGFDNKIRLEEDKSSKLLNIIRTLSSWWGNPGPIKSLPVVESYSRMS